MIGRKSVGTVRSALAKKPAPSGDHATNPNPELAHGRQQLPLGVAGQRVLGLHSGDRVDLMGGQRLVREELAGGIHHVFARGNAKQAIYLDDADRERYLSMLGKAVLRQRWRCLAYCLMHNHVHLLVETPAPNLGRGIQWLHSLYAQAFNERYRRSGHLFQGRFGAIRVKSDAQLLMVARYIARNPVEGGLCHEPEEWPWSSHASAFDQAGPKWLDTARLLGFFGASGGDSLRRYAAFIALR